MVSSTTDKSSKLPVEIEIENEKLYKMEIELEQLLQVIESTSETKEEFNEALNKARTILSTLRKSLNKFSGSVTEWEDHPLFTDRIKPLVTTHGTVLQSTQSNFQKSCLKGQKRLGELERSSLLVDNYGNHDNNSSDSKLRQRKMKKTEVASKNAEITNELKNIARIMDSQVKRSAETNEILESSSQQIREVHEEYKGLTGIINMSRKLLNKYNRRELTDNLLLFFGLILFFATVIYIVSKRI